MTKAWLVYPNLQRRTTIRMLSFPCLPETDNHLPIVTAGGKFGKTLCSFLRLFGIITDI